MSGNRVPDWLTAERLREIVSYDPETGFFRWLVKRNRNTVVGSVAGCRNSQGYWWIVIEGSRIPAHRLAFLYVTGCLPSGDLDHRNGDRSDNRWSNLRELERASNARNRLKAHPRNSTGLIGVTRDGGVYRASIVRNRERINLGSFDTAEQAHAAYLAAKAVHHPEVGDRVPRVEAPQHRRRRVTADVLPTVRELAAQGIAQKRIGEIVGFSQAAVCKLLKRDRAHV